MAIDNKFANTRAVSIGELLSQEKYLKFQDFNVIILGVKIVQKHYGMT